MEGDTMRKFGTCMWYKKKNEKMWFLPSHQCLCLFPLSPDVIILSHSLSQTLSTTATTTDPLQRSGRLH